MDDLDIRLAAPDDIEPICRLYDEFFAYNAEQQPQYYAAAKEGGEYLPAQNDKK